MIGKTISHYRILEKLGEGGMGVVYKAEDTELKREVAIKFLPPHIAKNDEERARFKVEAQAAAALNHNNIATIYNIGEADDETFIVMEYIKGQELKDKIESGPLSINDTLNTAIQIGSGLQAANEKGVVHRDIKSANIMFTDKGDVKIMDFGLAKVRGGPQLTKEQTTLGTAAYMSPEQTRGEQVDHRSDIFSLGVLIYEMLAGQLPFKGDYEQAVTYSILNEEAEPVTSLRTGIPMELERIVNKCLEKDAQDRYQHVDEMIVDLRKLKKESETREILSKTGVTPVQQRSKGLAVKSASKLKIFAMATFGIATLIALFLYFQKGGVPKTIRLTNPQKITQAIGRESWPTWSPDGSRIAYTSDQSGRLDVWIKQLKGGEPINRTENMASGGYRPSWSPDGSQIAFRSNQDWSFQVWVMPAIGGRATKVASTTGFWSNQAWSPDGTRLVYVVKDSSGEPHAELYTLATHEKRAVALPGTEFERTNLSWSPHGDYLAYTDAININGILRIFRLADSTSFEITTEDRSVRSAQWSKDGRLLNFSSDRGGTRDLWQATLNAEGEPDGELDQISSGLGLVDFAFSPDFTKIAYAKGETISNLWRVTITKLGAPTAQWTHATQLTFESSIVDSPELSPDGERIYFSSTRSGNPDIWSMPVTGGELRQLTTAPGEDASLSFSPDGRMLAFKSDRSGKLEIWTMPAAGGAAKQLTNDPFQKWWPRWSPDGQSVAYVAQDSLSKLDIWIVPAQGGEARRVTQAQGNLFNLLWWHDGQSLVTTSRKPHTILRFATTGGSPELLTEPDQLIAPDNLRWSEDKKHIYFMRFHGSELELKNIWNLSVADGSLRQLTDFSDRPGSLGRSFAMDGTYFYFTWHEDTGDIWVMDVEWED